MLQGAGSAGILAGARRPAPVPAPSARVLAHPLVQAAIRKVEAQQRQPSGPHAAPGVEPGVSGRELLFQHSRAFGPGPIKPFPGRPLAPLAPSFSPRLGRAPGGGFRYGEGRVTPGVLYEGEGKGPSPRPLRSGGELYELMHESKKDAEGQPVPFVKLPQALLV